MGCRNCTPSVTPEDDPNLDNIDIKGISIVFDEAENTEAVLDSSLAASESTSIPAAKAGVADGLNIAQKPNRYNRPEKAKATTNRSLFLQLLPTTGELILPV